MPYNVAAGGNEGSARSAGSSLKPVASKRSALACKRADTKLRTPSTQLAKALTIPAHWFYDRIHNGTVAVTRDDETGLYLFPDKPQTLEKFKRLRAGKCHSLKF